MRCWAGAGTTSRRAQSRTTKCSFILKSALFSSDENSEIQKPEQFYSSRAGRFIRLNLVYKGFQLPQNSAAKGHSMKNTRLTTSRISTLVNLALLLGILALIV